MINDSSSFVAAWLGGKVCLHPTDTLPGLSFDPENTEAMRKLLSIKGYESKRPFVSLLSSLELARKFWQPLPETAEIFLAEFWPGPLTLSWKASDLAPKSLLSDDGYIAIRVPNLGSEDSLIGDILNELKRPFPTTSVNEKGASPIKSWIAAFDFCQKFDGLYSPQEFTENKWLLAEELPSSLIRVGDSGSLTVLRHGALAGLINQFLETNPNVRSLK